LALLRALDRARGIAEVRGMARRPFDPAARGLRRIVYQQGDVLNPRGGECQSAYLPVPELAVDATAGVVARLPFLPAEAQWIEALRRPVIMDTAKGRRVLAWHPRHDAAETLVQIVAAAREDLGPG